MKRPIFKLLIIYSISILVFQRIILNRGLLFFLLFLSLLLFLLVENKSLALALIFLFLAPLRMSIYNEEEKNLDSKKILKVEVVDARLGDYKNTYQLKAGSKRYLFKSKAIYRRGDRLSLKGRLKPLKSQDNFHVFSYRKHLKSKKIFWELDTTKEVFLSSTIRGRLGEKLKNNLLKDKDPQMGKLMEKLILAGDGPAREDLDKYRKIGLAHILSISGLHINIFILILEKLGELSGQKKKKVSIFIFFLLLFYGYLIYFPLSLQRALIMYGLSLVAMEYLNIYDRLNSLYLAGLIILLINPYSLYSLSFYLSFLSLFGLFYVKDKLTYLLPGKGWKPFRPYLAIQLSLLPIQLYIFDEFNLASFFANLLILPIFELFIIFSVFSLTGLRLIKWILNPLLKGLFILIEGLADLIYSWDFLNLNFSSFNFYDLLVAYLLIILLVEKKRLERIDYSYKRFFFKSSLLIFTLNIYLYQTRPLVFINMVDVGQGDCILYRDRYENILFDLGGNPMAKERSGEDLIKYLKKNKVKKLDKVFISHLDFDHMGNLYQILGKIPIDKIYIGQDEVLDLEGQEIIKLSKDEKLRLGQAKLTTILEGAGEERTNDSSLVLGLEVFSTHLLLTGDIEENEKLIGDKLKATDILKVSHHGSASSSQEDFLDSISIKDALISVGQGNGYGHPSKEVLKRLDERSIKTYRTDLDGNILIIISPRGYRIYPYNHL